MLSWSILIPTPSSSSLVFLPVWKGSPEGQFWGELDETAVIPLDLPIALPYCHLLLGSKTPLSFSCHGPISPLTSQWRSTGSLGAPPVLRSNRHPAPPKSFLLPHVQGLIPHNSYGSWWLVHVHLYSGIRGGTSATKSCCKCSPWCLVFLSRRPFCFHMGVKRDWGMMLLHRPFRFTFPSFLNVCFEPTTLKCHWNDAT